MLRRVEAERGTDVIATLREWLAVREAIGSKQLDAFVILMRCLESFASSKYRGLPLGLELCPLSSVTKHCIDLDKYRRIIGLEHPYFSYFDQSMVEDAEIDVVLLIKPSATRITFVLH